MQKNEKTEISTMERWLVKATELAVMAKLTFLIREWTIIAFNSDCKLLMDFLLKKEENELVIYRFDDYKG